MLMTFFYSQLSQPNFRNSLDLTIRKGENFLERFASREFSTIELIARFLSLVELDKNVQIVKGGKEFMWKFGNPRCWFRGWKWDVVVDGFECSFWSNKIVYREGNVYLLLTIWFIFQNICIFFDTHNFYDRINSLIW